MNATRSLNEILDSANELRTTVRHNMAPLLNAFSSIRQGEVSGDESDLLFSAWTVATDHFGTIMDQISYILDEQIDPNFTAAWEQLHPEFALETSDEPLIDT